MARKKDTPTQAAPTNGDVTTTNDKAPDSGAPENPAEGIKPAAKPSESARAKNESASFVTVFANLPHGFKFHLPGGRVLDIKGYPVSKLVGTDGETLPAGQYGTTRGVKASDWEHIEKHYGELKFMRDKLVFAEADFGYGMDRAEDEDQASLRHGMEQADPKTGATKPHEGTE